jgi:N-acetylglutamate synthase-like GNAT family acetyltransferase
MKSAHSAPDGYAIQYASENDIPLLYAIEAVAGTIFPSGSLPENILAERVPRNVFMDAIAQRRLLVIKNSNEVPVGFAFWQEVDGYALLALIEVDPQHGQKGLGTALVWAIIEQVEKAGLRHLYLTTFSNIPWNASFYQRLGFVLLCDAEQPDFIKDTLREEHNKGLSNRVAMRYSI